MPGPAPFKLQRIREKGTNTFFHVRVASATTCETRHLPTPTELLTRTVDKPTGYTFTDLNCSVIGTGPSFRPALQNISKVLSRPTNIEFVNFALNSYNPATDLYYMSDLSIKTPADFGQGNRTFMYLDSGRWYTAAQRAAKGYKPFYPNLVSKFLVDTSQPRNTWRDQPTLNDNQIFIYV